MCLVQTLLYILPNSFARTSMHPAAPKLFGIVISDSLCFLVVCCFAIALKQCHLGLLHGSHPYMHNMMCQPLWIVSAISNQQAAGSIPVFITASSGTRAHDSMKVPYSEPYIHVSRYVSKSNTHSCAIMWSFQAGDSALASDNTKHLIEGLCATSRNAVFLAMDILAMDTTYNVY